MLCVAGRGPLDEAAAAMRASCSKSTGWARVPSADAVATMNILRLETSGVAMVCLSYLDTGSLAHMRYTIRRMRRELPTAQIMLGCWKADADTAALRDSTKPEAVATTLREAVKLCLEAARIPPSGRMCNRPRRARPRHRVPPLGAGLGRRRLPGISYRSHRFVGPMMTPTMLCSTGVHSMPNPGVG